MTRLGVAVTVVVAAVSLVLGIGIGYSLRPVPRAPSDADAELSGSVATPVAAPASETPAPAPASPAEDAPRPGAIVVRGNGPKMDGPFTFKPGGYVLKYEQLPDPEFGFNPTSFVAALESKPQSYDQPYQLLTNTSARRGTTKVTVSGKLWVNVSSSANEFVLTFEPLAK